MRYSEQLIRYALGPHVESQLQPTPSVIPVARMNIDETPTDKKRCSHCNCKKKLGLTAFSCKCGLYFCPAHRPAEEHACSYDYKNAARTQLEKESISAVKDKLERI